MRNTLILLTLVTLFLIWTFVINPKKVELTDPVRVLQGVSLARPFKAAVAEYYQKHHKLPTSEDWRAMTAIAVDLSQSAVRSIKVGEETPGVIEIRYYGAPGLKNPVALEGQVIRLIPEIMNNQIAWTCFGTLSSELLPRGCVHQQ